MNAIVRRELVSMLRNRKTVALQVLLVIALELLLTLRWPADGHATLDGSISAQLLRVFGYGLMTVLILIVPVFPATSIVKERVQGTLKLIMNSPIRPRSLVLGKLVSNLSYVFLMIFLSLPAAAACFTLGGISLFGQLGAMYLVLVLLGIQYTTMGLLISSYAGNIDSALRMVYGAVLTMAVLTLGPYAFIGGATWLSAPMVTAIDWIRAVSPIPAMAQLLSDAITTRGNVIADTGIVQRYCIVAGASSILFVILTIARLNSHVFDRARSAGQITDDLSPMKRAIRRVMFLWFFDPQRRSSLIAPWQNPVMVKESRSRRFGRSGWLMRMIGGCLILSLLLVVVATSLSHKENVASLGAIMVLMQMGLIILITPSLAAGLISSEVETRSWQLLKVTPLSLRTIILGKLLSAMITLSLVVVATLPAYLVLIVIDPGQLQIAIGVIITLALSALSALAVSACVSSLCRRTAVATAISYALLVSICAGTILIWLGRDAPFNHALVEAALRINPLAAALNLIGANGFADYRIVPVNWYFMGAVCVVSFVVLTLRVRRLMQPR